jgi:hypothetical protein
VAARKRHRRQEAHFRQRILAAFVDRIDLLRQLPQRLGSLGQERFHGSRRPGSGVTSEVTSSLRPSRSTPMRGVLRLRTENEGGKSHGASSFVLAGP